MSAQTFIWKEEKQTVTHPLFKLLTQAAEDRNRSLLFSSAQTVRIGWWEKKNRVNVQVSSRGGQGFRSGEISSRTLMHLAEQSDPLIYMFWEWLLSKQNYPQEGEKFQHAAGSKRELESSILGKILERVFARILSSLPWSQLDHCKNTEWGRISAQS